MVDRRSALTRAVRSFAGRAVRGLSTVAVVGAVLVAVLVAGRLTGLLPFEPVRIPSASMAPTLRTGDHVLLDRSARTPCDGDVVVAADPLGGPPVVKRVVAVAGESVGISGGVLEIGGVAVDEPYADRDHQEAVWFGPVVVPPGHVFLLGDQRDDSVDSRSFGPVPVTAVQGTVRVRIAPDPGPV